MAEFWDSLSFLPDSARGLGGRDVMLHVVVAVVFVALYRHSFSVIVLCSPQSLVLLLLHWFGCLWSLWRALYSELERKIEIKCEVQWNFQV